MHLDIAGLIKAILDPPMTKVGVLDIESFFSSKDTYRAFSFGNIFSAR